MINPARPKLTLCNPRRRRTKQNKNKNGNKNNTKRRKIDVDPTTARTSKTMRGEEKEQDQGEKGVTSKEILTWPFPLD